MLLQRGTTTSAALFGLLVTATAALGQTTQLSLDEAIDIAKANNPLFLSTANDVDQANWEAREAYGQFLPSFTVGGGAQYTDAGVQRFGVFTGSDISAGTTDYFISDYFMQAQFNFSGQTLFRARTARANSRATRARVGAAEFNLESAVTVQYLAALRAREAVEVAERQVARWNANHETVSGRVQAGAALSTDGKQAEVDLGRAQVTLLQAENLYRTEVARLMEQMGNALDGSPELVSDFQVFEPSWDRDELLVMASSANPSLQAFVAAEKAAGSQVNEARSGYFPSISASANWSGFTRELGNQDFLLCQARSSLKCRQDNCILMNALNARISGGLPGYEADDCSRHVLTPEGEQELIDGNSVFPLDFTKSPLSVQVRVSLPIFQGFSRQRQIAQASSAARDAQHNRRAEELRLRTAVTQSYDDLNTAYSSLQIQERNLEVAGEQLELASQRYELGAAAFIELLDAEDSMAQAERDHLAALYDFHQAMWALEAAVGTRLRPNDQEQGNN